MTRILRSRSCSVLLLVTLSLGAVASAESDEPKFPRANGANISAGSDSGNKTGSRSESRSIPAQRNSVPEFPLKPRQSLESKLGITEQDRESIAELENRLPGQLIVDGMTGLGGVVYRQLRDARDPGRDLSDPFSRNCERLAKSIDSRIRAKAAKDIVRIPDPSAAKPMLKQALKTDSSVEVRKTAALMLGRIGDEECRDILCKAMTYDRSESVRSTCARILLVTSRNKP